MKLSIRSVLFLGIGGISMHQLALAFKNLGVKVYGYDAKSSKYTELCKENGIKITSKFEMDFCSVDLCVKTGAIKEDNKYIQHLKLNKCKIVDRAEVLSWFCKKFKHVIAVAGTHGKSTTAGLIYDILRTNGEKVSCHIGADIYNPRFNLNDDYLVVEACEYNKSFLSLFPKTSVVTNVEAEHMDCYSTLFNLRNAFLTFLKRGENRFVYLDNSTKYLKRYKNINFVDNCNLKIQPKLKGEHNFKNIALAVAVCKSLGVGGKVIINSVNNFVGLSRRYEYLGNFVNTKVYIDYAHHPTEINYFIQTFKQEFKNSLIIFQPHTFSRTKTLLSDFKKVFRNVENLIIIKEYPAREKPSMGLSAKQLYYEIKEENQNVKYCSSNKKLMEEMLKFDAVAFVGAGDINLIAEKIVKSN